MVNFTIRLVVLTVAIDSLTKVFIAPKGIQHVYSKINEDHGTPKLRSIIKMFGLREHKDSQIWTTKDCNPSLMEVATIRHASISEDSICASPLLYSNYLSLKISKHQSHIPIKSNRRRGQALNFLIEKLQITQHNIVSKGKWK